MCCFNILGFKKTISGNWTCDYNLENETGLDANLWTEAFQPAALHSPPPPASTPSPEQTQAAKGLQKSPFQLCCIRCQVVVLKKKGNSAKQHVRKKKSISAWCKGARCEIKIFCSVDFLFLSKFHYYGKKSELNNSLISFFVFFVLFCCWFFFPLLASQNRHSQSSEYTEAQYWGEARGAPPLSGQAEAGWRDTRFHIK